MPGAAYLNLQLFYKKSVTINGPAHEILHEILQSNEGSGSHQTQYMKSILSITTPDPGHHMGK